MSLNATPSGERIHISFFGCTNAGKSSVVNAFTGQNLSIVSDVSGTTTDPVSKAMELLPLGPVKIIDTAGIDDISKLGDLRINKTKQVLNKTDIAVLVADCTKKLTDADLQLTELFKQKQIPYIIAYNKADLLENIPESEPNTIYISALTGYNINALKDIISKLNKTESRPIISDLIEKGDLIVLVVPIDSAAPKGRLILPQQQVIRDALDHGAVPVVVRDSELDHVLKTIPTPKIIITDSQVFGKVSKIVPENIPLTSFSIVMARYKGDLPAQVHGARVLDTLNDGDKILIAEGCTHHRQCDDIGTVKLPRWITDYTNKKLDFNFCSGGEFPEDLSGYKLVVHCGGCMLNQKEIKYRFANAKDQDIPITNYGTLIAYINGILPRTIKPFNI